MRPGSYVVGICLWKHQYFFASQPGHYQHIEKGQICENIEGGKHNCWPVLKAYHLKCLRILSSAILKLFQMPHKSHYVDLLIHINALVKCSKDIFKLPLMQSHMIMSHMCLGHGQIGGYNSKYFRNVIKVFIYKQEICKMQKTDESEANAGTQYFKVINPSRCIGCSRPGYGT